MKIKIEPERLTKLLDAGMITRSKPLLDPMTIHFDKDGAFIKDVYSEVLAVYIQMSKKYFLEYEAAKEDITIPSLVTEKLGWGFTDDSIVVSTDKKNEKITLKGERDSFTTDIENTEPHKFPFELVTTPDGIVRKEFEYKYSFKMNAKELKLPVVEQYNFELKDGKLTVTIAGGGDFKHEFLGKAAAKEDVSCILSGEYYNAVAENLEGDITLFLTPDSVVFCEKKKDISKTYFLSALME